MTIKEIKTSELKEYENNPRHNENAVEAVAASIKEFGFKVPIIIDKNKVIVAGYTRLKAAETLGIDKVPCIIADDLTDEQIKAFRLADNKTAEIADWNFDKLEAELEELRNMDFDMTQFGFDDFGEITENSIETHENPYSEGVKIPQYEPTGENVEISELYDAEKAKELINEIENANVPDEIREFLKFAAYRHIKFNFKKIAEFYANSDEEIQNLFEKSALVIIDINDALANGWVKLSKTIEGLIKNEE